MGVRELEDFAAGEADRLNQADALTASLARGSEQNPDEYAKALVLSAKTGVSPAWAKEFGSSIERRQKSDPIAVDDLIRKNPKTAAFLANPDNAAIAHDDVENMSGIENALTYIVNPVRTFAGHLSTAPMDLVYGGLRYASGLGSTLLTGPLAQAEKSLTGYYVRDPLAEAEEFFGGLQQQNKAMRDLISGDQSRASWLSRRLSEGAGMAGSMMAAIPASIATGNPAAALYLMSAQSAAGAYGEARDKGVPIPTALSYGAIQGGTLYATSEIPVSALIKDLGLNSGIVKTLINQVWHGTPAFQIQTALQDLNDWAVLPENADKPFSEYLAERPNRALETLVSGLVANVIQSGGGKAVDLALHNSEYRQQRAIFEALGQLSTESKLRQRLPDKFREFVEKATEDGPVKDILVPVEHFDRYFQSKEMNPERVAADLNATNYAEAKLAGTDVSIPIADFAEKIAPTEHLAGLQDDFRLRPGALTAREARELPERLKADVNDRITQVIEELGKTHPLDAAITLITENVERQLIDAGMEPSTARDQAAVMRGVAVLANRAFPEMNPLQAAMQAWGRYGLTIESPSAVSDLVDIEAGKDQAKRDAEARARAAERGGPRLEDYEVAPSTFIKRRYIDNGGPGISIPDNLREEFRSLSRYHKEGGVPIDQVAEDMFNEGLIEEPTINALLDRLANPERRRSLKISPAEEV